METSNDLKKLEELLLQIRSIYADTATGDKFSLEKRITNYNQGTKCIDIASQLLTKLQQDINSMDLSNVTNSADQKKVNQMVEFLENPKLTLPEALSILRDLKSIRSGAEMNVNVVSNVKQDEVVLEEVADF